MKEVVFTDDDEGGGVPAFILASYSTGYAKASSSHSMRYYCSMLCLLERFFSPLMI